MAMASSREPPGELRRMVETIFTARLDLRAEARGRALFDAPFGKQNAARQEFEPYKRREASRHRSSDAPADSSDGLPLDPVSPPAGGSVL